MFKISKEFHFSASHQLPQMPDGHPCKRLHGHNYVIIIELMSYELDEYGFVLDYHELDGVKRFIDDVLDHRHLNDIFPVPPTAEYMSKFIYDKFKHDIPQLYSVSVKETPKTIATYSGWNDIKK
ncbi:MAG: 6-carboxytetrahydropterin synthase [Nanoarchaeota archaeon]|nr:6-carboxytetrahydropterin synthase [Nanoarchaeota archaeon]